MTVLGKVCQGGANVTAHLSPTWSLCIWSSGRSGGLQGGLYSACSRVRVLPCKASASPLTSCGTSNTSLTTFPFSCLTHRRRIHLVELLWRWRGIIHGRHRTMPAPTSALIESAVTAVTTINTDSKQLTLVHKTQIVRGKTQMQPQAHVPSLMAFILKSNLGLLLHIDF